VAARYVHGPVVSRAIRKLMRTTRTGTARRQVVDFRKLNPAILLFCFFSSCRSAPVPVVANTERNTNSSCGASRSNLLLSAKSKQQLFDIVFTSIINRIISNRKEFIGIDSSWVGFC
jgi:hypothetical protein